MELKRFDDSSEAGLEISGCTLIEFSEPDLSEKTLNELTSIDENIRAAEQLAGSILLS